MAYTPFPIRAKAEAKRKHPKDPKRRAAFLAGALWGYRERYEPLAGLWVRYQDTRELHRPETIEEVIRVARCYCYKDVIVEDVSREGTGYQGPLSEMPRGRIEFIGPDPNTDRQFRGWLIHDDNGIRLEEIKDG